MGSRTQPWVKRALFGLKRTIGWTDGSRIPAGQESVARRARPPGYDRWQPGAPLYDPKRRLAVFWTGKAGCTVAVRWYFFQVGELQRLRAETNDLWPHKYRVKYCGRDDGYYVKLENCFSTDYLKVKFVRNPYRRAVSSYLTVCQMAHLGRKKQFSGTFSQLEAYLGRKAEEGFTFREFVEYLARVDLTTGDIHYRQQWSREEESGALSVPHIVKVEDLPSRIHDLERQYGLKDSSTVEIFQSAHHRRKAERGAFSGDQCLFETVKTTVPNYLDFYDESILQRVSDIYRKDFENYDYPQSLDFVKR